LKGQSHLVLWLLAYEMIVTGQGFQFFKNEAGSYKIGFLFADNSWLYIMLSILSVTK